MDELKQQIMSWLKQYVWHIVGVVGALLLVLLIIGISTNWHFSKQDHQDDPIHESGDPIVLTYYRWQDKSNVLDEIIELYQQLHPHISIIVQQIDQFDESDRVDPRYDYQEYITQLIADGEGPDMFAIRNDWLPRLVDQITPLSSEVMNVVEYEDKFPSSAVEDFVLGSKVYAIPYSIDNLMLFYNPEIFRQSGLYQPPNTWQEVIDITPRLTQFSNQGMLIQSAINLGLDYESIPRFAEILATLIMQYGGEMTNLDRSEAIFDQPTPDPTLSVYAGEEALKFYTSFADPQSNNVTYIDKRNPDGTRQFPSDIQAFGEGKMAMLIHASYAESYLRKFYPNMEFTTAPLPQLRSSKPVVVAANYWGETVSKNSQHPAEAWDFINFVAQRSNLDKLFKSTGHVSSLKETLVEYSKDPLYGPIAQQVNFSRPWHREHSEKIEKIFSEMISNVLNFNISPSTAVKSAAYSVNNIKT